MALLLFFFKLEFNICLLKKGKANCLEALFEKKSKSKFLKAAFLHQIKSPKNIASQYLITYLLIWT